MSFVSCLIEPHQSEAFSSLAALESYNAERIWQMALSDKSSFVKDKAEHGMDALK